MEREGKQGQRARLSGVAAEKLYAQTAPGVESPGPKVAAPYAESGDSGGYRAKGPHTQGLHKSCSTRVSLAVASTCLLPLQLLPNTRGIKCQRPAFPLPARDFYPGEEKYKTKVDNKQ